jgi:hypothetical protein
MSDYRNALDEMTADDEYFTYAPYEDCAAPAPAPAPDKFSGRTDADNRSYMADVLGMPRPVWVSTPRAFTADSPSKRSAVPSRKPVTRSHRHHSEAK